jgi:hypothetical protein
LVPRTKTITQWQTTPQTTPPPTTPQTTSQTTLQTLQTTLRTTPQITPQTTTSPITIHRESLSPQTRSGIWYKVLGASSMNRLYRRYQLLDGDIEQSIVNGDIMSWRYIHLLLLLNKRYVTLQNGCLNIFITSKSSMVPINANMFFRQPTNLGFLYGILSRIAEGSAG